MKHSIPQLILYWIIFFSLLENVNSFIFRGNNNLALNEQWEQMNRNSNARRRRRRTKIKHRFHPFPSCMSTSKDDDGNDGDDDDNYDTDTSKVRYLGRGSEAIVRVGCVLLPPAEEFHHYLRQAAVFIYAMGTDDTDEYVIRGVIVDNPTPFSMGEMMEHKTNGGVYENLIHRGGDTGGEDAFCLHSDNTLGLEEIGKSKLYQGGDVEQISDRSKVKFFFNYMEFLEQELEDMLDITHDDGDCWSSVEVPPEMILNPEYDKGECWTRLRNSIRGM